MSDIKTQVKIADEVIASIASKAVLEVEGVAGMAGNYAGDLAGKIYRWKPAKGVTLQIEKENVHISLEIVVKGGVKIQDVARDVQQKVKTAIETMTGYTAYAVNVHVAGLVA